MVQSSGRNTWFPQWKKLYSRFQKQKFSVNSTDPRDVTTFAALDGLYRYKRLFFGVNMAKERFQQLIWQILKDCPGAYNLHDNVRVVGRDHKEHDENLDKAMRKFEEHGLTLH